MATNKNRPYRKGKKSSRAASGTPAAKPDEGQAQSPGQEPAAPVVRVSLDGYQKPVSSYNAQLAFRDIPGSQWKGVNLEDIGKFEEVVLPKEPAPDSEDPIRVFPSLNNGSGHPFIEGDSPFIYYVLTPVFTKTAQPKARQPVNINNKLSKKDRERFIGKLDKNIDKMSLFWTDDLLPTTLALESALDKVEEFTLQAADVAANLNRDTIKKRFQQVVDIKLLRFAADSVGITKEEHQLLLQQLIQGPRPVQQFMVPVTQRNQQ